MTTPEPSPYADVRVILRDAEHALRNVLPLLVREAWPDASRLPDVTMQSSIALGIENTNPGAALRAARLLQAGDNAAALALVAVALATFASEWSDDMLTGVENTTPELYAKLKSRVLRSGPDTSPPAITIGDPSIENAKAESRRITVEERRRGIAECRRILRRREEARAAKDAADKKAARIEADRAELARRDAERKAASI